MIDILFKMIRDNKRIGQTTHIHAKAHCVSVVKGINVMEYYDQADIMLSLHGVYCTHVHARACVYGRKGGWVALSRHRAGELHGDQDILLA